MCRPMIRNENELATIQQRIAQFQGILAELRVTATPQEFPFVASGYKSEIEMIQSEVLDYLTRHSSSAVSTHIA